MPLGSKVALLVRTHTRALQVGSRVYENVPKKMRTQLWLSLLDQQKATASSASSADVLDDAYSLLCEDGYYSSLVDGFTSTSTETGPDHFVEDVGAVIGRDISRTFPTHTLFQTPAGRAKLQRVLHAYAIQDPAVGYCQGMAFVAGILLMHLSDDEHRAFAALVMLMHAAGLRNLYLPGMVALQLRLRQLQELLRRRQPQLSSHLETYDVSPVIYASSWFLSLFAAEFPYSFTARILDVMLAERSCAVVLRVALGLLDACEQPLLELHDFEALIMYLKLEPKTWPADRLRDILTIAISMEGIDDKTLAVLAEDIAHEDAAEAAAEQAAEATTPRGNAQPTWSGDSAGIQGSPGGGESVAAADAAPLLIDVSPPRSDTSRGGAAVAASPRAGGVAAHHSRHLSRVVLEQMLQDMDLEVCRVNSSPSSRRLNVTADGTVPSSPLQPIPSDNSDAVLEDWVTIAPPMSGGTLGVLATGGTLPPVQPRREDGPNARPSLRMLKLHGDGDEKPPDLL